MRDLLHQLEALKLAFEFVKPVKGIEENIRRESLLKSSLYSAKIEGNQLSYDQVQVGLDQRSQAKLEVFNLLKAYRFVYSKKAPKKLSFSLIKTFHRLTMNKIIANAGSFRNQAGAIFNQAGVAIYVAPPPDEIMTRLKKLIIQADQDKHLEPEKAFEIHFKFEKIHPFVDGNGRVGRLITAFLMNKYGYGFKGLVSIEELINQKRSVYYDCLGQSKNWKPLCEFLLRLYVKQGKKILARLSQVETKEEPVLPLRRQEIFNVIKDHPYSSFDFIHRRFFQVNPKTLHYDLKKLQEENLIVKVGKTRGVVYKAKKLDFK